MESCPLISVIIPTSFRQEMLISCVASLLGQDYPNFEIIVVDQATKPQLQTALRDRFGEEKAIHYIHLVAAGAARARNVGIRHASALYVAFIDDDAVATPGWLRALADGFADDRRPALIAGRILPLWYGQRPAWYPRQREYLLGLYDIGDKLCILPPGDLPIGANMAGLRQVILDHGGFDESLGPNYFRGEKRTGGRGVVVGGEETVLGERILASGHTIVYQPRAEVKHHVNRRKQTRRHFLKRNFSEGVITILRMGMLGQIGSRWPHIRYHTREICLAVARFILPGYAGYYSEPHVVIRMMALARVSFSLGVLRGLQTGHSEVVEQRRCASA